MKNKYPQERPSPKAVSDLREHDEFFDIAAKRIEIRGRSVGDRLNGHSDGLIEQAQWGSHDTLDGGMELIVDEA